MALEEEEETQNAPFCMLFCEEESSSVFEEDERSVVKSPSFHLGFLDHDMLSRDDDELLALISKEEDFKPCLSDKTSTDEFLSLCRENALGWIFRVKSYYGFSSLTALLAVSYFDRFVTSRKFQTDKPWMSQLTAVACLSLAAKVEEIRVPLLLDLQVGEARYVFEAKTIQRMELLILSTL
ncbi:cyclin-D3-3-like, partial [Raphanus sativus]|uniref:Cyclin-D3-3-like n=1 Tax=Raphanus sativus TaxID=3726 RepID=A0A9W3D011_RAPSA